MSYIIKQYKNRIKRICSEKIFFLKKYVSRIWDSFISSGHEKFTIMFIPHNEKNIFNFHISRFTILFFMLLFFLILVTSGYAIIKSTSLNLKKEKLLSSARDITSDLESFEMLTEDTEKLIESMKPYIEDIYILAKGDDKIKEIWESEQELYNADEQADNANMLSEEIITLRKLRNDIIKSIKAVKTVKNFIYTRSRVVNEIPSTYPNRGTVTSLFGWRKSPFGFKESQFHYGIDISAASGTPIHATAPGIVVYADWIDGYGNTVRIQHKYGYCSLYGHCSKIVVKVGDRITKGQEIAYVGSTGTSTGNHCHYGIYLADVAINPFPFVSIKF